MATDPQVSRAKFAREVKLFQKQKGRHAKMGIWMLSAEFPEVLVAFATPKSQQVFVPFAALVDFTDYDAKPLKVTLVHAVTRQPLKFTEVLPHFFQNAPFPQPGRIPRLRFIAPFGGPVVQDSILQGYDNHDAEPFLCMPGVRSYHEHPAHTGDSWWLHKLSGVGCLDQIINTLWKYGARNITGQNFNLQVSGYVSQLEVEQALAAPQVIQPVLVAPTQPTTPPTEEGGT